MAGSVPNTFPVDGNSHISVLEAWNGTLVAMKAFTRKEFDAQGPWKLLRVGCLGGQGSEDVGCRVDLAIERVRAVGRYVARTAPIGRRCQLDLGRTEFCRAAF